ncbi:nucleotide-binding domain-containing protein [Paraburkholderia elongata]|uniref:nucleotide-binding domain-containing protein n=1 Tax=Paraburkholderia elongata TaxID=2675747 RepID=UPI0038B3B0FE
MQVRSTDKGSSAFVDVPTALKTLFDRLDDWLQANPNKPTIRNPVLFEEVQSAAWDDTKYANFRAKMNLYRGWIDDAYDELDKEESIGKWQRVFGEDFAAREAAGKASKVSEAALAVVRANQGSAGVGDLVALVRKLGRTALPYGFDRLPHMRRPRWRVATGGQLSVNVDSQLWSARHGQQIRSIQSLTPAQPGYWVRFNARNNLGFPFPDSYKVEWRVTNTDEAATRANALRGDYYRSDEPFVRWERLSYRGVHMVEAFLIRKADDTLVGRSDPFYVVIE